MRETYDVLVVGAGPSGSLAAKTCAEGGLSVLLIEKHREIGVPVCCAEGISKESLFKFVKPDSRWISTTLNGARLFSPDGTKIEIEWKEVGYVLERKIFDKELASLAEQNGASVMVETQALGMERIKDMWKVKLSRADEEFFVFARAVVGADGVESLVGRWGGIDTTLKLTEFHSCAQFLVELQEIEEDRVIFYVGWKIVPGGYAWVFPKGGGKANVGLGITPALAKDGVALDYAKKFLESKFPKAKIIETTVGGCPANNAPHVIVSDGLLLVGDAGRLTDPLSGAGIAIAMESGKMAGEVLVDAMKKGDVSKKNIESYERIWREKTGKEMHYHWLIRKVFLKLDDEEMNRVARILVRILDGRNPRDIEPILLAQEVVRSDPRLLLLGRHLL